MVYIMRRSYDCSQLRLSSYYNSNLGIAFASLPREQDVSVFAPFLCAATAQKNYTQIAQLTIIGGGIELRLTPAFRFVTDVRQTLRCSEIDDSDAG